MRHLGSQWSNGPELDRLLATARRSEVLQDILRRVRQEILPARIPQAALATLANAVEADGAAIFAGAGEVLAQVGSDLEHVAEASLALLAQDSSTDMAETRTADGRSVMTLRLTVRFEGVVGLSVWRRKPAAWQENERLLIDGASTILAVILDHQAIERQMARQSRTDHLTGLLNRRAFFEELLRHIDRLEREQLPGTLILADLDGLRGVNDRFGLLAGDRVLVSAGKIFRIAVRPTDLVARLGADDFALWLNGADHMTAAERAEQLRKAVPEQLAEVIGSGLPRITLSIGIATRPFGSDSAPDDVISQAELALEQVKREARGHWRVARQNAA